MILCLLLDCSLSFLALGMMSYIDVIDAVGVVSGGIHYWGIFLGNATLIYSEVFEIYRSVLF